VASGNDITVRSTKILTIRDILDNDWDLNLERYSQIAVYIANNLNQNITVEYYGGTAAAPVILIGKGGVIAAAGGTASEDFTGAMGWVRIRITAAGVPVIGEVTVYVDGEIGQQTAAELHGDSHGRGDEDEITSIITEIDVLDAAITACCGSGVGSGLSDRVTVLENEIDGIEDVIDTLGAIIGTCTSGVGSGLCQRVEQLEGRVSTNEDVIDTHGIDIEKNKKSQYTFIVAGALTSGIDVTPWLAVQQDCTLTEGFAVVKSVCSGIGGIDIEILKSPDCGDNWSNIIASPTFVIDCGDKCVKISGLSIALDEDDLLRMDIASVGSVIAAEDLSAFLRTTT
jgi:hypothetical protein